MDTSLPEGFELDNAPESNTGLPDDFVLDNSEQPQEKSSDFFHNMLKEEPGYTYGAILPFKKNEETGETSLAVPEMLRSPVHGVGDLYQSAENQSTDITPDALNAMLTLVPFGPGGKGIDIPKPTLFPKAAELSLPKDFVLDETPATITAPVASGIGDLPQGQQEALAQVAIGARNPTTLTPEQTSNRLADANYVPPTRNPEELTLYHTTRTPDLVFEEGKGELGTHLASRPEQANAVADIEQRYTDTAVGRRLGNESSPVNVMPVQVAVKNPLRLRDDHGNWAVPEGDVYGLFERTTNFTGGKASGVTWEPSKLNKFSETDNAEILKARDMYAKDPEAWRNFFVPLLKKNGYDGIVYKNAFEDLGTDSYIVFDPSKIRSAISDKTTVKDIDAQIKQVAADTSLPGAKEQLAALQQQKAELQNPQLGIDKRTQELAGKITDEQFDTNIRYPVQNALDSGVPLAHIKNELEANLAVSIKDPAYRAELAERAIPEAYKQASEASNTAGLLTHTDPDATQALTQGAVKYPDDGSVPPSLVPENQKQLGADAINSILSSKLAKGRSSWVDDLNLLSLVDRAWFKLNNKNIGRRDIAEAGDLTLTKNLSQRGAEMMHSLVGDASGTNNYILKSMGKSSILEKDRNILPLNTSIKLAKNGGMTDEEISEFLRARDAYDDYANIDRLTKDVKDNLDANTRLLKHLQDTDTTGLNGRQRKTINNKIQETKQDIAENKQFLKESENKQSHIAKPEVGNILNKYANNPVAQTFGDNVNKLHSHMLDMLVDSGKISAESAVNLRRAHPNYLPAWRDVDDFTFGGIRYQNTGGSAKPFKSRDISNKELGDVYENMVNNIVSTSRKVEQAKYRGTVLQDFLLPKLDNDGFKAIFREDKQDVLKAIDDLNAGKRQRISAEEITPTNPDKVQQVGNIVFDINGRQLQLTIKDFEMFKELSQSRVYEETNAALRAIIAASRIRRNLITSWNVGFSIRAFERDAMDFIAGAKATPFKDYIPVVSNFKYLFTKDFDPELYDSITNNLGFGSTVARSFYGKNAEQIINISKKGLSDEKSLADKLKAPVISTGHSLENFANRTDIAPRILQYKIAMKNLVAQGVPEAQAKEQAMRLARELNVNYAQKGTQTGLDQYIKTVTFARTFINSTDRLIRYARYEPVKLARNTFIGIYLPYAAIMHYNKDFKDENGTPYVDKLDPNLKKDMMPVYGPWSKDENDYIPWRLGWVFGRSLPAIDKSVSYAQQQVGSLMDRAIGEEADKAVNADNPVAKEIKKTGITGKEVYSAWLDYTFGLVQPTSMLPVGASDAAAVLTNTDSFGRTIVPEDLKKEPAFAQFRPGETSQGLTDFAYYLQQKTGNSYSPIQAEYLLNSLFSSAGAVSMTAGNYVYAAATGRELPSMENKDIPLFNTFSGHGTDIPKEGMSSQFYNVDQYLQDIGTHEDALTKATEQNPAHAPDLLQYRQDNAIELHYLDKYKDSLKTIKNYRDAIAQIVSADKNSLQGDQTPEIEPLGDPIKRKKVDELRTKIIDVQKAVLNDIEHSNLNTDDIWFERLTRSPATKLFETPANLLDKATKKSDNTFFEDLKVNKNEKNK